MMNASSISTAYAMAMGMDPNTLSVLIVFVLSDYRGRMHTFGKPINHSILSVACGSYFILWFIYFLILSFSTDISNFFAISSRVSSTTGSSSISIANCHCTICSAFGTLIATQGLAKLS